MVRDQIDVLLWAVFFFYLAGPAKLRIFLWLQYLPYDSIANSELASSNGFATKMTKMGQEERDCNSDLCDIKIGPWKSCIIFLNTRCKNVNVNKL